MVLLSTAQTAEKLNAAFGTRSITAEKVLYLVHTKALHDLGPGRSVKIDEAEIDRFTTRVRPVGREDWPSGHSLFRVSLIELREDPIYDAQGTLLRTHAGVDYSGSSGIPLLQQVLAWTGVWEVSEQTVQRAVQERAILFGTTKGYIDPKYVEMITGARRTPSGDRIWWETTRAPAEILRFVGTGLWMPVKPGRESDWA